MNSNTNHILFVNLSNSLQFFLCIPRDKIDKIELFMYITGTRDILREKKQKIKIKNIYIFSLPNLLLIKKKSILLRNAMTVCLTYCIHILFVNLSNSYPEIKMTKLKYSCIHYSNKLILPRINLGDLCKSHLSIIFFPSMLA